MKNSAFGEDDVMDYQQEYLVVLISAIILWYNGRWIVESLEPIYKTNNLLRLVYCFGLFGVFIYTRTSVIEWVFYTGAIFAGGYNKLQLDKLYREIENENKHLKKIAEEQSKAFPLNYNER